jgi:hypothetical protein
MTQASVESAKRSSAPIWGLARHASTRRNLRVGKPASSHITPRRIKATRSPPFLSRHLASLAWSTFLYLRPCGTHILIFQYEFPTLPSRPSSGHATYLAPSMTNPNLLYDPHFPKFFSGMVVPPLRSSSTASLSLPSGRSPSSSWSISFTFLGSLPLPQGAVSTIGFSRHLPLWPSVLLNGPLSDLLPSLGHWVLPSSAALASGAHERLPAFSKSGRARIESRSLNRNEIGHFTASKVG